MKIQCQDGVLRVTEVKDLDGAEGLCEHVRAHWPEQVRAIEVDLSQTEFLNSSGLGQLLALQKMAVQQCGKIALRVLNPSGPIQQFLELTRTHRIFEILKR